MILNNENSNYNYPKLHTLEEFFATEIKNTSIDFSKIVIIACQHILEPQKSMFQALIKLGFLPENIFVLGKAYSTNSSVLKEIQDLGIYVIQPEFKPLVSFDVQHAENCKQLLEVSKLKRESAQKVVVLDDGAMLIGQTIHEGNSKNTIGVEQTSSGFRRLESRNISFPIYNVARSKIKLELETPHVVELGIQRIEEKLQELGLAKPNILIVGLGVIGTEMQKALIKKSYPVVVHDEIHGHQNVSELIQKDIQMVIGTTGSQILSHDELLQLDNALQENILLVSMSSSDREFELWKLRDLFKQGNHLHDDVSFGNIIITNNGFPVTFKGNRFEGAPEKMERTICLLFSGVCLGAIQNIKEIGLIDLPDDITGKLV